MKTLLFLMPLVLSGQTRNVVLTWNASTSPGVLGYNIYRGPSSTGPWTLLTTNPVAALTYTDSTALIGSTYDYAATAVAAACTPSTPPNQPCGESAQDVAVTTVPPPPVSSPPNYTNQAAVVNPSFETLPTGGLPNGCGTNCAWDDNTPIPGWSASSWSTVGQFQPVAPFLPNHSTDGTITNAYSNGPTISQTLTTTATTGYTYILKVDLGVRTDLPFTAGADLLVNGNRYYATGTVPASGGWATWQVVYTATAADNGMSITIELTSGGSQAEFDNVRVVYGSCTCQ